MPTSARSFARYTLPSSFVTARLMGYSATSSGIWFFLNVASNAAWASLPAPAPWYRSTMLRASWRFSAYGSADPSAYAASILSTSATGSVEHRRKYMGTSSSLMDMSLPNMSFASSVRPT